MKKDYNHWISTEFLFGAASALTVALIAYLNTPNPQSFVKALVVSSIIFGGATFYQIYKDLNNNGE